MKEAGDIFREVAQAAGDIVLRFKDEEVYAVFG